MARSLGCVALLIGFLICKRAETLDLSLRHLHDSQPANSKIIASAGDTEQINGNGDILPEGQCKDNAKLFCPEVIPGAGRLVTCLSTQIKQEKQGNTAGRTVTAECAEEVAQFKIERSKHINRDVPLALACKDDAADKCEDKNDSLNPGSVIACLRDQKAKLMSHDCKREIIRTQVEAVDDYRTDYGVYTTCKKEIDNLCKDVEPGEGREIKCMLSKRPSVTEECWKQLARLDREMAEDIRLNTPLFTSCYNDQKKFCKDVEPGQMKMQECLEDNMDKPGFSSACRHELDDVISRRVADFTLDAAMRNACQKDLENICSTTLTEIDNFESKKLSAIKCLQDNREELIEEDCKAQVHRMISRAARDIRFDEALAAACSEDRAKFCKDVQPGSARVIRCLQDKRPELSSKCGAALFDHEIRMAEDIDFQYPMKRACAWEIGNFCHAIPHGHARIIRCLQKHLSDPDMSKECRDEVAHGQQRMNQDYRLNYQLNQACREDITQLCDTICNIDDGKPCGGLVLHCLRENQDNITASQCKDEVLYYQLMEVSDYRNDVILAEACRQDVQNYCGDIEPGEGRVHQCLRFKKKLISEACAREESKLQAIEYRDIRLRPRLQKLCSEERVLFCKDIPPGKARVIKCLMEHMNKANFGQDCREELEERQEAVKNDYRFDVGVYTECAADVDTFCADAKKQLRGNATVLRCLSDNYRSTQIKCQEELSQAVRMALWDYKPGAALTAVCDEDVEAQCPKGKKARRGGTFTIGAVGRCLSMKLVQGTKLQPKCASLVLLAAPADVRMYLEIPSSTTGIRSHLATVQKAMGADLMLVDPYTKNGGTITVTGWAALACVVSLFVVTLGSLVLVFRKLTGQDQPQDMHVKMGDA